MALTIAGKSEDQSFAIELVLSSPPPRTEKDGIVDVFTTVFHRTVTSIERLSQGWTNHNYKVQTDDKLFFVRIGTDHPESLHISREKELQVYRCIEDLAIAPPLQYAQPSIGLLVSDFIEHASSYGKVLGAWTGSIEQVVGNVIELMKKVHSKPAPKEFVSTYAYDIIGKYVEECSRAGVVLPATLPQALAIVEQVKKEPLLKSAPVLCHHDFFWENLLFDGHKLWLVDWEYADWDDPFYDLAGFCIAHRILEEEEQDMVLRKYFSVFGEEERKKLKTMCLLYSLKNALWGFLQIALCPNIPFDIRPIANMHYETFWAIHQKLHTTSR